MNNDRIFLLIYIQCHVSCFISSHALISSLFFIFDIKCEFPFCIRLDIVSVNGISVCVEMILTLIRKIQLLLGSIFLFANTKKRQCLQLFSTNLWCIKLQTSTHSHSHTHNQRAAVKSHTENDEK